MPAKKQTDKVLPPSPRGQRVARRAQIREELIEKSVKEVPMKKPSQVLMGAQALVVVLIVLGLWFYPLFLGRI